MADGADARGGLVVGGGVVVVELMELEEVLGEEGDLAGVAFQGAAEKRFGDGV